METALHRVETRLREFGADHEAPISLAQSWLSRLLRRPAKVIERKLVLNPPARPEELAEFEQRFSVTLPDDVVASYLYMNGTEEYTDLDAAWMRFLPIEEWARYRDEFPSDPAANEEPFSNSFVFADHGIAAWFFAIDLDPSRLGHVYSLTQAPHRVALSFSDFVNQVLESPDGLFRGVAV